MSNVMLRVISSMATRQLLAELISRWSARTAQQVQLESVGGIDAARRVQAGEPFDAVILASDAIDKLIAAHAALADSKVDLVRSPVAIAIGAGAPRPDIGSQEALRRTVVAACAIGYSTGPSGAALLQLFERWGVMDQVRPRLVQAPAGVPVGSLVARGEVTLGFQQRSELMHIDGIEVIGAMPEPVQILTTFSGAICASGAQHATVRDLLAFMAAPESAPTKRHHGMEPA